VGVGAEVEVAAAEDGGEVVVVAAVEADTPLLSTSSGSREGSERGRGTLRLGGPSPGT
jgi:hypothetical protein